MSNQSTRDPRVTLLAHTVLTADALTVLDLTEGPTYEADHLAEIAGRQCYESWDRPNPATAANADYLAKVIRQQHTSVLAHASFTFRLVGVSRSLTHELIRHRFLAVSEVSQRYVNMETSETVVPPLFRDDDTDAAFRARCLIHQNERDTTRTYEALVALAVTAGATRKQAREAARCVLPGGTETKMIVTGNVRAWRDFIAQRNAPGADAEIREIAAAILGHLHQWAPNSVADLTGGTQ